MTVLNMPTLVLNSDWQPIGVKDVGNAVCMAYNNNARIVDPEECKLYDWEDWVRMKPTASDRTIQLVNSKIKAPEVIVVNNYYGLKDHAIVFNRRNLFIRDKFTCQYCGIRPGSNELSVDHIIPRSKGGISSWTNCVLACIDCNSKKGDKHLKESNMKLSKQPIKPKWSPIFKTKMIFPSWEKFLSEMYWNIALEP